ncbi:radical SAM protein [Oscillospiraceae bacterium CM]|nr:radical SAM protein [Oscillospiraceae bacterium CM]
MKILKTVQSEDCAVKHLLSLNDGSTVEALYMYDKAFKLTYHSTVCVSSQVGCTVGCRFCATGRQGFLRNLNADEILGEVLLCDSSRKKAGFIPMDAVVFAGMGEPLLNYANVLSAIDLIQRDLGITHFELATVGIVPRLYDLIADLRGHELKLRLNLSLHGATDEKRLHLIPYTRKYGLSDIVRAAADFADATGTTARIRYMLIKGFNDTDADIDALTSLLKGKPFKLVLSAYNDNQIEGLAPTGDLDLLRFYNKIKDNCTCDLFHNFGSGVLGGCGQLRQLDNDNQEFSA